MPAQGRAPIRTEAEVIVRSAAHVAEFAARGVQRERKDSRHQISGSLSFSSDGAQNETPPSQDCPRPDFGEDRRLQAG